MDLRVFHHGVIATTNSSKLLVDLGLAFLFGERVLKKFEGLSLNLHLKAFHRETLHKV